MPQPQRANFEFLSYSRDDIFSSSEKFSRRERKSHELGRPLPTQASFSPDDVMVAVIAAFLPTAVFFSFLYSAASRGGGENRYVLGGFFTSTFYFIRLLMISITAVTRCIHDLRPQLCHLARRISEYYEPILSRRRKSTCIIGQV